MSEVTHDNINIHNNKLENLKNKFINSYHTDKSSTDNIIKEMRILHGCAIYDDELYKKILVEKNVKDISDSEWIKLSANASLLHIMHCNIRKCEKLVYNYKKGLVENNTMVPPGLESDSEIQTTSSSFPSQISTKAFGETSLPKSTKNNIQQQNKITTIIKPIKANVDEISLQNITTDKNVPIEEIISDNLFSDIETVVKNTDIIATGGYTMNTSEYIDNLTTTEAERLVENYDKFFPNDKNTNNTKNIKNTQSSKYSAQTGGIDYDITKPTLVNYWADWCGASLKFYPEWEKFEKLAGTEFPSLQVVEVNGAKYPEVVKKANVKMYPTMVFYYNNTPHQKVGYSKTEDIIKFVKGIVGKN